MDPRQRLLLETVWSAIENAGYSPADLAGTNTGLYVGVGNNDYRQMLRGAGAKEIHMRISAPPIRHACHYGVDMSTTQEMVAHGRSVEEIAEELNCDSLAYLSLDGVYEAIRSTRETHCDACFSGEYPLERTDGANGKFALEELAVIRS